jgi:hypothetical protein
VPEETRELEVHRRTERRTTRICVDPRRCLGSQFRSKTAAL